jgi:thiosulfate/3-mercaptopyruvate sulfurtransferase
MSLVDVAWLHAHLQDPALRVLDASMGRDEDGALVPLRGAFEAAHIPGARFVDVGADLSDPRSHLHFMLPGPADFARAMAALDITDARAVVVYATENVWWATRAWFVMRAYCLPRVAVLDGGLAAWRAAGFAVESGPSPPAAGVFAPRAADLRGIADVAAVRAALARGDAVVNALSPAQHTGAVPGHYGRPGRIAGSINIPGAALLDGDGRFLPVPRLAEVLAPVLGRDVITYCGGGVTATAVTFALALLGYSSRVYDASLEEWSANPDLPMSVG